LTEMDQSADSQWTFELTVSSKRVKYISTRQSTDIDFLLHGGGVRANNRFCK